VGEHLLLDVHGADAVELQHDRIREAVLSSVTEEELGPLRLALARTIEADGSAPDATHRAAELYRAAGSVADAQRLLPRSAEAYARAGLLSEALVRYDELTALLQRGGVKVPPDVRLRRGELLAQVGRTEESVRAFHAVAEEARHDGSGPLLSDALRHEARSLELLGQYPEALELLAEAREEAAAARDEARKGAAISAA